MQKYQFEYVSEHGDEVLVSRPGRLCAGGAVLEAGTSLRGSDPCAPDLVETKSFVER